MNRPIIFFALVLSAILSACSSPNRRSNSAEPTAANLLKGASATKATPAERGMATYLGKVMVDPTPQAYNARWRKKEKKRCSHDLPYADGLLGFKVSNTADDPVFTLTYSAPGAFDYNIGPDASSGYRLALPKNVHRLYARYIKGTSSPFFLHMFQLYGRDDIMQLPEEFVPIPRDR